MRPFFSCAVACLASVASADWRLSDYATPATDSAAVHKLYGIQSFSNPASATTVIVSDSGYVSLVCSKLASDTSEGYSANIGLMHPIKKDWSKVVLTGLIGVTFDIRYSVKPTDGIEVVLGSSAIAVSDIEAAHVYSAKLSGSLLPAAPNTWKTVTLEPKDFVLPTWWTEAPLDFPSLDDILASGVEQIQFSPRTTYSGSGTKDGAACTMCVIPTTQAITLGIRNLRLVDLGGEGIPNPELDGCLGVPAITWDEFQDGDNVNEFSGYWNAYSDTSTDPAKDLDSARGTSTAALEIVEGDVGLRSGLARVSGHMNKNVSSATFPWRPYAGWFGITSGFQSDMDFRICGLTGIEFSLDAKFLGPQVKGIKFKVEIPGVDRAYSHYAFIPARLITKGSADYTPSICVRPEDLHQESWVTAPNRVPFSTDNVSKFAWEVAIDDQVSPSISQDSASFTLTDIRLHGNDLQFGVGGNTSCGESVVRAKAVSSSMAASYRNGVLSLTRAAGFDHILVVASSGVVQKRFVSSANQFALPLDRGTYYVVARDSKGQSLSRSIAVVR